MYFVRRPIIFAYFFYSEYKAFIQKLNCSYKKKVSKTSAFLLTDDVEVSCLALHGVSVDLTHVPAPVRLLHVT